MARPISFLVPTFILFSAWAGWAGCGAGAGGSGLGGEGSGASGTGGDGNSAGFDPGGDDGGLQDGEVCEAEELDSQPVELDIFLVIDRSSSMSSTLWGNTISAIKSFVAQPLSAGINMGLNFFPPEVSSGTTCAVGDYNPIQYPASMPPLWVVGTDNTEIGNVLDGAGTEGMTPMYAALDGTYQVASTWQSTYPNHKTIIVLTGDGSPNSCGNSDEVAACAGLAAAALGGTGIDTYTVLLDTAAKTALDAIALAGGTNAAYDVSSDTSQFAQVMNDIRDQALGCEFVIPAPTETDFDPTKVNVTYYAGGVGEGQSIPQVANQGACGGQMGWYFDNAAAPTRIILCPTACTLVEADLEPKVSIRFGCPTQTR